MEVIFFDLIFCYSHWKRFVVMNLDFYLFSEIGMCRSSKTCIEKHARNVWRSSKHLFGWTTLSRTSVLYSPFFYSFPGRLSWMSLELGPFYNTPSLSILKKKKLLIIKTNLSINKQMLKGFSKKKKKKKKILKSECLK